MQDTVGELHKKACEVFDLIPDEVDILLGCLQYYVPPPLNLKFSWSCYYWQVCIWDYYGRTRHSLMDNLEKTLDDANIQMDQDVSTGIYVIISIDKLCFLFLDWCFPSWP